MKRSENSRFYMIEAREAKGLTVEDVAKIFNYSVGTIRHIENGRSYKGKLYKAGREFFEKASEFYDMPIEKLMQRGRCEADE